MGWKKLITLSLASTLLLACGNGEDEEIAETDTEEIEEESDDTNDESTAEEPEETEEEESWEEAMEDVELDLENEEEIPWDDIHLTQSQFDGFLDDFLTDMDEDPEESIVVEEYDFDEETIHIYISNQEEEPELAEFSNSFFALVTDSFVRQFYLHSDYSDEDIHPLIIIEDVEHGIISELADFAEFEE